MSPIRPEIRTLSCSGILQDNYCFFAIGTICKVYPKGVKIFKRLSI